MFLVDECGRFVPCVSVDRSGNFVTPFFGVFWFRYFSSVSAVVLFSGVSVNRSGNFVTPVFLGILV